MPKIRWDAPDEDGRMHGYHVDHANGQITMVQVQDPRAIIRRNKLRRANDNTDARRRSGQLYEIADIPNSIVLEWKAKYGVDMMNKDHFRQVLELIHSREYAPSVKLVEGDMRQHATRNHFAGSRDRSTHPLASNRAGMATSGGLVDTNAWRC